MHPHDPHPSIASVWLANNQHCSLLITRTWPTKEDKRLHSWLLCGFLTQNCKKDEECCEGQLCVLGQCMNSTKGKAGTICQEQSDCDTDLCCVFYEGTDFYWATIYLSETWGWSSSCFQLWQDFTSHVVLLSSTTSCIRPETRLKSYWEVSYAVEYSQSGNLCSKFPIYEELVLAILVPKTKNSMQQHIYKDKYTIHSQSLGNISSH